MSVANLRFYLLLAGDLRPASPLLLPLPFSFLFPFNRYILVPYPRHHRLHPFSSPSSSTPFHPLPIVDPAVSGRMEAQAIPGLLIGANNAFGLGAGIFLLAYGLVELPRRVWRKAEHRSHLDWCLARVGRKAERLEGTRAELDRVRAVVRSTAAGMSARDPLVALMERIARRTEEGAGKAGGGAGRPDEELGAEELDYGSDIEVRGWGEGGRDASPCMHRSRSRLRRSSVTWRWRAARVLAGAIQAQQAGEAGGGPVRGRQGRVRDGGGGGNGHGGHLRLVAWGQTHWTVADRAQRGLLDVPVLSGALGAQGARRG